jgi:hypothetical protein
MRQIDGFLRKDFLSDVHLRQKHQLLDHALQDVCLLLNDKEVLLPSFRRIGHIVQKPFDVGADRCQRRPYIMGNTCDEFFSLLLVLLPFFKGLLQLLAHQVERHHDGREFIEPVVMEMNIQISFLDFLRPSL